MLDCLLVLILLLLVAGRGPAAGTAVAGTASPKNAAALAAGATSALAQAAYGQPAPAVALPGQPDLPLDSNTQAAMIAAENVHLLFESLYTLGLPLVTR